MYVYLCVCVCVCMYVFISLCVCVCLSVCVCAFICVSVCVCVCVYIRVCVCLCICLCVCSGDKQALPYVPNLLNVPRRAMCMDCLLARCRIQNVDNPVTWVIVGRQHPVKVNSRANIIH